MALLGSAEKNHYSPNKIYCYASSKAVLCQVQGGTLDRAVFVI